MPYREVSDQRSGRLGRLDTAFIINILQGPTMGPVPNLEWFKLATGERSDVAYL